MLVIVLRCFFSDSVLLNVVSLLVRLVMSFFGLFMFRSVGVVWISIVCGLKCLRLRLNLLSLVVCVFN